MVSSSARDSTVTSTVFTCQLVLARVMPSLILLSTHVVQLETQVTYLKALLFIIKIHPIYISK